MACEILVTEDHNEHIARDEANVVQEGTKITATAKSHLNGEVSSVGGPFVLSWRVNFSGVPIICIIVGETLYNVEEDTLLVLFVCRRTIFGVPGFSSLFSTGVSLCPSFLCSSDLVFLFSLVVDPADVFTLRALKRVVSSNCSVTVRRGFV